MMARKSDALVAMASMAGKKSAENLTAEERKDRATLAAEARWSANQPKATHGSPDRPLMIGEIAIPCYVLDNKKRVIVQMGMIEALGMTPGGSSHKGGSRLAKFVNGSAFKDFAKESLLTRTQEVIQFRTPTGKLAYGFDAEMLADICEMVLEAKKRGDLDSRYGKVAERCWVLMRGFARVGIIALIDEATGYQYDRPRKELEEQLKKFLSDSLRRWVRTFPADYFKHLCRLRGVELRPDMRLPQYFGKLTNNLVYRRLAPGLVKMLKDRREERGSPSNKLHSWLSQDVGFPEVLVHLGTVVGLMKVHTDYEAFEKQLDTVAPMHPKTPGLFDDPTDWEEPRVAANASSQRLLQSDADVSDLDS